MPLISIYYIILKEYESINDEVLHRAFMRVRGNINNPSVVNSFYRVRDDIGATLRGCANNVTVEVVMEGIPIGPIVVSCGNGENKLQINIDNYGKVTYYWQTETWGKHFRNAAGTVNNIAKSVVSSIGSFFGGLFTSKNSLEGTSKGYLTY